MNFQSEELSIWNESYASWVLTVSGNSRDSIIVKSVSLISSRSLQMELTFNRIYRIGSWILNSLIRVFFAAHHNFFLLQNIAWNVRKKKKKKKENFIAKFTEFLNILSFSAACDKKAATEKNKLLLSRLHILTLIANETTW